MENNETVTSLPLEKLKPFPDHPFRVLDDDAMADTVESIKAYGVLTPALVRPLPDGNYEIIAGHRRKHACELAGLTEMPVIIKEMDRDAAIIAMVDSNLQRETILPSERAKAYKMKLDAIKRQGERKDLTCGQVGHKSRESVSINESGRQVQRYVRLTELNPKIQSMVDEGKIGFTPAVELSYLKPEEQEMLLDTMEYEQSAPSFAQAQQMRRFSQIKRLTEDRMLRIMTEQKRPETWNLSLPIKELKKYFPEDFTPKQMIDTIMKLLDGWHRKRVQNQQR